VRDRTIVDAFDAGDGNAAAICSEQEPINVIPRAFA